MTILFVDVDTQLDFCDKEGALYVNGGEQIISTVAMLNAVAENSPKAALIGCVDTHAVNDPEFNTWPKHCVKGTKGWLKHPLTLPKDFTFLSMGDTDYGDSFGLKDTALYFEKRTYGMLSSLTAQRWVTRNACNIDSVAVYGLALDFCVKGTALGFRDLLPNVKIDIINTACRAVRQDSIPDVVKVLCDNEIGYIDHVTFLEKTI